MRTSHGARLFLMTALLAAGRASAADATIPAGLVGTWRLVAFEDVVNGQSFHPYGEKPLGLFVYTADGHVAIQIANPANPACVPPGRKSGPGRLDEVALPACSPEEMRAMLEGYVAYWGTYTVDVAAGVVIHHVRSDLGTGYAGTDQRRPFKLDGDRLVIGDGKTWTRVLQRVR